jgi:hypothetical protein
MYSLLVYNNAAINQTHSLTHSLTHSCRWAIHEKPPIVKSHCDWRSVGQWVLVSSPIWGPWPDLIISVWQTRSSFRRAPSLTRGRMSFVYAAGPCQRSVSRVLVSSDFRPYLTVSHLRLPFSSPLVQVQVTLRLTVSQSVSLGIEPHLGLMTRYLLLFGIYGLLFVGRPLWREDGSAFCICCWPPGLLPKLDNYPALGLNREHLIEGFSFARC